MKCKAKTKSGGPCKAQAMQAGQYCFTHDPASGKARATARKLGGMRNRTGHSGRAEILPATVTTIREATRILDYTLAEIIPMENSIARGRLLIALVAGYINAFEIGELENRLAAIETALKAR
jgi:hypothetical protein